MALHGVTWRYMALHGVTWRYMIIWYFAVSSCNQMLSWYLFSGARSVFKMDSMYFSHDRKQVCSLKMPAAIILFLMFFILPSLFCLLYCILNCILYCILNCILNCKLNCILNCTFNCFLVKLIFKLLNWALKTYC
jgi:hypothetical protein